MNKECKTSDEELKNKFLEHLKNPNTTMTPEKLADLKGKCYEKLCQLRQKLIMEQPFVGGMLMRFDLVPTRDYRNPTACTDYERIFFDIDFMINLDDDERLFVLAHEIWHAVYLHSLRRNNREHDLWNISADCEINYMLKNDGFKAPEDLCYPDPEVEGKSAEEIYEHFLKKMKGKQHQQGKSGSGNKQQGQSGSGNKQHSSGSNGSGKKSGSLSGQFDKHIGKDEQQADPESGTQEGNSGGGKDILPKDRWGEKGEDSDYTPKMSRDIAEKMREAIISEAQKAERQQGKLPGALEDILNKLRTPEIDWREKLAQYVTSCIGDERRWVPPARRHVWEGLYLQSRRGQKVQVVVTVDTSGSTTADLPKFMGELVSLLDTFGNYEMTLIQCDAEVHSVETYDGCNPFPVDDPKQIKWKGFGGSDLRPAFDEIVNRNIEASIHIVFTDGYISTPEKDPLGIPTMFILTKDGDENLCDWGEKVRFKNDD